jgi:hypothetical protein
MIDGSSPCLNKGTFPPKTLLNLQEIEINAGFIKRRYGS